MSQPARGSASPGVPVGHHALTCRDPILGRPTCLDLPGDSISRRLSCFSLHEDMHPDLGTPGSQVATLLGRISLKRLTPKKVHHGNGRKPIIVGLCPASAITEEPSENPIAFLERLKEALQKFTNLYSDSYEGQVILKKNSCPNPHQTSE